MVGEEERPEQAPDAQDDMRERASGWTRFRRAIALAMLALVLVVAGGLVWLDSGPGHRMVAQRIAALAPSSGLKIEIGRIDGSLYRNAVLHDVRLSDPKGVFLSSPLVRLNWWPVGWLSNRLDIDSLVAPQARLHRLPKFNRSKKDGPILPDFDIRIMRLSIGKLNVDKAVMGQEDAFTIEGDADVRSGTAVVDLSVRSLRGDDRLVLALDSRPDDRRFDVDLTANAPAGGVLAALAGLKQDANVEIKGKGDWDRWKGRLVATLDQKSAAGFTILQRRGRYTIEGTVAGEAIAQKGALARLVSPSLAVKADGTFANRLISGHLVAASDAASVDFKGGVHLGGHGYDNLTVDFGLKRPQALLKDFDARGLVARMRFNGPFSATRFEYLLRAERLIFGKTMVEDVHAAGEGRAGGKGEVTIIPLRLRAARVRGQGDITEQILRNFSLDGTLRKQGAVVTSTPLKLRSDKLDGTLLAIFDLKSGRYDMMLSGKSKALMVPGLGIVDVEAKVKAVPDRNGKFGIAGVAKADVRRFDNAFLRAIAGGLPRFKSDIGLGADGYLRLRNLSLRAPLLTVSGEAMRKPDKSVEFRGNGKHIRYGPFRLALSGRIERPKIDLLLEHPLEAVRLADVHLLLDPDPVGYRYNASGNSVLGPFASHGMVELPRGGQAVIAVNGFAVNGSNGEGRLPVVAGGLSGRLLFSGPVTGPVDLAVANGVQTIGAALRLDSARFEGAPPIDVVRGRLNASIALDPKGAKVDAALRANGVQFGTLRINALSANTNLVNGEGKLSVNAVGQRGRLFNLRFDADMGHDDIRFTLGGSLDRQSIALSRPGRLSRIEGGWELDPVSVRYRGGGIRFDAASFGAETRFDATLQNLPLSLLDLGNIDLGLGGMANGRISYARRRGAVPTGSASLSIKALTRSGVTRTSVPIDLGLNGKLTADRLAMRAVASQKGAVIGRGQALMTPLGQGNLIERLRSAPMRAQLRYVGPAEALWRMTTIEIVDLNGQVGLTADIGGTGAAPVITGRLLTRDAVLESPITGMRVSALKSQARFDGSRLVFSQISGTARNGGQVSGQGSFDFSLGQGVGIDLALRADNAELLNRDDIGATVNGPLTIKSDGVGGVISGDFDVVRSHFTLGRAAAVAEIPELRLIEKNGRPGDFVQVQRGTGWRLDMKARARNRLMVSGMGLSSEWRMNLDIGGNVASPMLLGRADLIRGSYDFAGRRFDLTSGSLRFDGSVPANPALDITAQATVSGLDATIRITGTSAAPQIAFSSNPALPQEEVLSRILFGSSITQLSAPEALQLASAVGSLQGGGGLDPINAVRKAAGLDRLRILPADSVNGQGTSIGAGKYVTRKIYVELITDGQGYSATRVEYQVTRWLSLLSAISTLGRESMTVRISKDY